MGNKITLVADFINRRKKPDPETGHDPAVHGARQEDYFYNDTSFKDTEGPKRRTRSPSLDEERAAIRIQAGIRGYMGREEVRKRKKGMSESSSKSDDHTADATTSLDDTSEEIDIDLNDPAVKDAAVKIQAGFKGFKTRKALGKQTQEPEPEPEPVLEVSKEKEDFDIDLNDPEVSKAAVKIQSGFRGHIARQEIRQMKDSQDASEPPEYKAESHDATESEEQVDIDLNDPEVEKAAIKIQAGFKGYKTRKTHQIDKKEESSQDVEGGIAADTQDDLATGGDLSGGEVDSSRDESAKSDLDRENAAVKIQAGYRENETRKDLKSRETSQEYEGEAPPNQEEEVDIDLTDPEVEKAAVKIQASFKGFKARKEIKSAENSASENSAPVLEEGEQVIAGEGQTTGDEQEVGAVDEADPEVEEAAVKIQAGFRGFKARKEIKERQQQSGETTSSGNLNDVNDEGEENAD